MTVGAGKVRILSVDVNEIVTASVDFAQHLSATLGENKVARFAVTGFDRHLAVHCGVIAIVTAKAAVPVFVTNKIRMRPPVEFHFRKKIDPVNGLRLPDDWP